VALIGPERGNSIAAVIAANGSGNGRIWELKIGAHTVDGDSVFVVAQGNRDHIRPLDPVDFQGCRS